MSKSAETYLPPILFSTQIKRRRSHQRPPIFLNSVTSSGATNRSAANTSCAEIVRRTISSDACDHLPCPPFAAKQHGGGEGERRQAGKYDRSARRCTATAA